MKSIEECSETVRDASFTLVDAEGGSNSKLIIKNPNKKEIQKVLVDGCVFPKGGRQKRCDFLVITPELDEHYVELKGKKVREAIKQLEATISMLKNSQCRNRFAYVVCSRLNNAKPELTHRQVKTKALKNKQQTTLKFKESEHTITV